MEKISANFYYKQSRNLKNTVYDARWIMILLTINVAQ
jgi:hypothetical protein